MYSSDVREVIEQPKASEYESPLLFKLDIECCKILDEIHYSNFQLKIRRIKHDLIIKLITLMDRKSGDECINLN